MVSSILYAVIALIEAVLGFRFVFRLAGANPASGFVDFMYDLSTPLVAPFAGIFGQGATVTGTGMVTQSVFDWTALIAIIAYGLLGAIVAGLFGRMHHHAV